MVVRGSNAEYIMDLNVKKVEKHCSKEKGGPPNNNFFNTLKKMCLQSDTNK